MGRSSTDSADGTGALFKRADLGTWGLVLGTCTESVLGPSSLVRRTAQTRHQVPSTKYRVPRMTSSTRPLGGDVGAWELAALPPGLVADPAELETARPEWMPCAGPMPVAAAL